jgi:hypothetical protein
VRPLLPELKVALLRLLIYRTMSCKTARGATISSGWRAG